MALTISDECIACGTCVESCPSGVIIESGDSFTIDSECTECRACVDSCPVDAICD